MEEINDEGLLRVEADRGLRAQRLLEDEILVAAFADIENGLKQAWLATKAGATAERENLWTTLKLLAALRATITETVRTGQLAQIQLTPLED